MSAMEKVAAMTNLQHHNPFMAFFWKIATPHCHGRYLTTLIWGYFCIFEPRFIILTFSSFVPLLRPLSALLLSVLASATQLQTSATKTCYWRLFPANPEFQPTSFFIIYFCLLFLLFLCFVFSSFLLSSVPVLHPCFFFFLLSMLLFPVL